MLKKIFRFGGKDSFQRVKEEGTLIKGKLMMIKYISDDVDGVKFGVVVSKKISKKAVVRNKIRRRIYESIRSYIKNNSLDSLHAILFVSKRIVQSDFSVIEDEVHSLIKITKKT